MHYLPHQQKKKKKIQKQKQTHRRSKQWSIKGDSSQ